MTRATLLARRLAAQTDLDLSAIRGSGPEGLIVRRDLTGPRLRVVGPASVKGRAPPAPVPERPAAANTFAASRDLPTVSLTLALDHFSRRGVAGVSLADLLIKAAAVALALADANGDLNHDVVVVTGGALRRIGGVCEKSVVTLAAELRAPRDAGAKGVGPPAFLVREAGGLGFPGSQNADAAAVLSFGPLKADGMVPVIVDSDPDHIDAALASQWLDYLAEIAAAPVLLLL